MVNDNICVQFYLFLILGGPYFCKHVHACKVLYCKNGMRELCSKHLSHGRYLHIKIEREMYVVNTSHILPEYTYKGAIAENYRGKKIFYIYNVQCIDA
jgi:hypothetical protein